MFLAESQSCLRGDRHQNKRHLNVRQNELGSPKRLTCPHFIRSEYLRWEREAPVQSIPAFMVPGLGIALAIDQHTYL